MDSYAVTVSVRPDTVYTMIGAADDGWIYHPKHLEQSADINKLYIVASCWTIIDTYYTRCLYTQKNAETMQGTQNFKHPL